MAEPRFIDALNQALDREMETDPTVIVLGEDVAVGGPFGVTAGLAERFGEKRVINTPISEDSIMGMAIGAAIAGKRPVIEIMFIDFLTLAMNQLVNHAAKLRYMSGGQLSVPMVIRVSEPLPQTDASQLGQGARIVRQGTDLTIVTYSNLVWEALAAAEELEKKGISVEVIDLRHLVPLDMATIVESVTRTNRALIAHEAVLSGGLGAEIAARLQEETFDWLDAPVSRIGAPFTPVPASPVLEDLYVPNARSMVEKINEIMA
jgi:pyruvate/2-oxoglutarate/acetoin dehydrogenase E1 component